MVSELSIAHFLKSNLPLVDVRSPGEYARGHIPGALNIPLFTDDERAHVGILYVRDSPEKAMQTGLHYVIPKLESFLLRSKDIAPAGKVAVHCWRGGMRSREFAGYLSGNGFSEVFVITGGYKAFRQYLRSYFDAPVDLRIIGGYTGSGKTEILHLLKESGHQVVDLEALACHKGSSFGDIGMRVQTTSEQFENNLFDAFRKLDLSKPVWLEDESHNIGGVNIPLNLFSQMQNSPVFFLDIPDFVRAKRLVKEYSNADQEKLAVAISRISKRLGGQKTREALVLLEENRFQELAMLLLSYYDKSYRKGLMLHEQEKVHPIRAFGDDIEENGKLILEANEASTGNKADGL